MYSSLFVHVLVETIALIKHDCFWFSSSIWIVCTKYTQMTGESKCKETKLDIRGNGYDILALPKRPRGFCTNLVYSTGTHETIFPEPEAGFILQTSRLTV